MKTEMLESYYRKLEAWKQANEDRKRHYPQFGPTSCECDDRGVPCLYDQLTYSEACGSGPRHPDDILEAARAKVAG